MKPYTTSKRKLTGRTPISKTPNREISEVFEIPGWELVVYRSYQTVPVDEFGRMYKGGACEEAETATKCVTV